MSAGLRPDDLLRAATEATGLEDFGGGSYRPGLDMLCRSANDEAALNELGATALGATITSSLVNRLRVVDWHDRHPEVAAEAIEAPVVVVGMFRAGTTLLSRLLDRDPANRSLLRWEAADSVPPAGPAELRQGSRVEAARQAAEMLDAINPDARKVHHEEADGPTECLSLLAQDFKSLQWAAIANVAAYDRWLLGVDQLSAYHYHRQVLQVLQSGGARGRWTLKSPHHAIALDALVATYPDARLVLLHRDPVVLCASVCSLIGTLSRPFSDIDHRRYIAGHWTAMLEESVRRIESFRSARPDVAVHDVLYADLVERPLETVEGIYRAIGADMDPAAAAAMEADVRAHPQGEFGVHRYDLESLGLDGRALHERFSAYREHYQIPLEEPARP